MRGLLTRAAETYDLVLIDSPPVFPVADASLLATMVDGVVMVVRGERLLAQEDGDIAERVHAALAADGVKVLAGHRALRCERETHHVAVEQWLVVDAGGTEERIAFDCLLCVLGRRARLDGYGLEELGVLSTASGGLDVDAWLQTLYPNIYAAGGVVGTEEDSQLAEQEGRHAAGNALFGGLRRHKVDKRFMPRTILVDPEVAVVGLDEQSAREQGVAYEVTTFDVAGLDRALADGAHLDRAMVDAGGIAKVLAVPGRDRILGVAIVAAQAAERLAEFVLAMQQRIGLERVLHAARLHPNGSEGSPTMADARQSGQRAGWLLRWTRRYHAWRRR
jgi:pyruvate/2-oxoglutarate dehydrogenase complex dihydrolipoamide dehydrogenase (E3) component